jgi:AcrR family transcriptional regulator
MTPTRERILTAGAELFRRQGYDGTGVKQIVATAGAPFGSLYHFFPGGKGQLGEEVIRWSGGAYRDLVTGVFDAAEDPVAGVAAVFAGAADTLRETGYADACPIATVALEVASTNEPLRIATADVFRDWIAAAGARFEAAGVSEQRARALAISMICGLEGAFVLSRALRSTEPLEVAGAAAVATTRAALAEPAG